MSKYAGLDWATKGWVGVILRDDGTWESDVFPSVWSFWKYHSDAERVLIDIPIGLPSENSGRRRCDRKAKEILKARHRSVFYAPIRSAVYETNIEQAKALNEAAGFSIQNQAWGLVPRIREVDEFLDMNPVAQDRLRETHPELCFHAFNGGPLDYSKHTRDGLAERRRILIETEQQAETILNEIEEQYTTPRYAPMIRRASDIVDAVAAALTAQRDLHELTTVPNNPPTDERGFPMEIVYPAPGVQTTLMDLD